MRKIPWQYGCKEIDLQPHHQPQMNMDICDLKSMKIDNHGIMVGFRIALQPTPGISFGYVLLYLIDTLNSFFLVFVSLLSSLDVLMLQMTI